MPDAELRVARNARVATIVIAHPAKRNAMTADMWRALPSVLDGLRADPEVRIVVLTGEGDTFCAGADIASLADIGADEPSGSLPVLAEQALAAFPKPTIAMIRGFCVGGGCQLALACDFRFASADARFGVTPAKLGVVYPAESTARLVRTVGLSLARHLLLSAELIDAPRAVRSGLVDELVEPAELQSRVDAYAALLSQRSALTQAAAKELIASASAGTADPERVAYWMGQVRSSGEAAEGAAAFLTRRSPDFPWRP